MIKIGRYSIDQNKLRKETHLCDMDFNRRLAQLMNKEIKMVKEEAEAYLKGMYLYYSYPYEEMGRYYPSKFVAATWTPSPNGNYYVSPSQEAYIKMMNGK